MREWVNKILEWRTEEWKERRDREREKGVDDKSRDYGRVYIRSWNSKIINLIVFSSVSYRISVAASCFTSGFLLYTSPLEIKIYIHFRISFVGVKSHVKFSKHHFSRAHTAVHIKCKLLRRDFRVLTEMRHYLTTIYFYFIAKQFYL